MKNKTHVKGLIERKLEDPVYRKIHDERYDAFKLEVQILLAMEKKEWSYSDLATTVGTSKGNISRDLKGGGLLKASFSRIHRMVEALGMKLVTLLIPKEQAHLIMPKIEELLRNHMNMSTPKVELVQQPALGAVLQGASLTVDTGSNLIFVQDRVSRNGHSSQPAESVRFEKFDISSPMGMGA